MEKSELNRVFENIRQTRQSYNIQLRELMHSLNCHQRTDGIKQYINNTLSNEQISPLGWHEWSDLNASVELKFKYEINSDSFKIYHLEISRYKNLKNISIDFTNTNNYCAFIGLNGSGKSNVLEAISSIFFSLYKIATVKDGHKTYQCPFGYKIVYFLEGRCYEIVNGKLKPEDEKVTREMLPKNIITSYSGEDERLWYNSYRTIFDQFRSKIVSESQGFEPPFMFYINKHQWGIAMLALLHSEDKDVVAFVESIIKGNSVGISFEYSKNNAHKWEGTNVGVFVEELRKRNWYTIDEFRECINKISFIDKSSSLFYLLYRSSISGETNLISKVKIAFGTNGDLNGLSEGEKKMILTNLIIHILSSENSLCLFDEPDSHIHILRKKELINLIDNNKRYSLLTTHSPVLSNVMNPNNIRFMDNGNVKSIDIINTISQLSDNSLNYISGALILSSKTPLILVEGIGDVEYIKKAISALSKENAKYEKLDFDILQMGGGGKNSKYFTDNIRPHITSEKRVIVLFDRDDSGCEGMKECANITGGRRNFETYKKDNWYYLMLPKTNDHMEDDFLIEDYFSKEHKEKIASAKVLDAGGHFNKYPKDLRQLLKDTLKSELAGYDKTQLCGFSVLLDKLFDIINETEQCKIL